MTSQARRQLDHAISETAWQQQVIDLARTFGWLIYHTHDSRRSQPGFPDLCMVRERVVFAELKAERSGSRGRITPEQAHWLRSLRDAGAEAHIWRPHHYPEVERTLRERR